MSRGRLSLLWRMIFFLNTIVLKTGVLPLAHDTQGLWDCAFTRRENGANKQDLHVLEHWLGAQRRTGYHQGDKLAGHTQPPLTFLGGNHQ